MLKLHEKKIENQSLTHGSSDSFECPFYKEKINRLHTVPTKKPTSVIRCIQINIQHSKSALLTLSKLLFDWF